MISTEGGLKLLDDRSLHQILFSFRNCIFNKYQLGVEDFINFMALPSLSFGVYRSSFMPENCEIRQTSGVIGRDIRKAYMGGLVEIFKPYGKDLVGLDLNNMYPNAMLKDMPTGQPTFIVNPVLEETFGFFKAEIFCPDSIKYPTLPVMKSRPKIRGYMPNKHVNRVRFFGGVKRRFKAGLETKAFARSRSYQFERNTGVFKEFVIHFYEQKMNAKGVDRLIAKLIWNSLYGRFGLCPDKKSTAVYGIIK